MSRERDRLEEIGKKIKREADASSPRIGGNRRSSSLQMLGCHPGTLNTITPCAACKLLRRRCAQECPFSPYFSPHEPHKFASVHKVFGASNVSKMLMEVPESQRADAANSLVYEANVRLRDPVYGCMGAISALQRQVQSLQAELDAVRAEILKHKYREANNTSTIVAPSYNVPLLSSAGTVSIATLPAAPLPLALPSPATSPVYTLTSSASAGTDYSSSINPSDNISYFG